MDKTFSSLTFCESKVLAGSFTLIGAIALIFDVAMHGAYAGGLIIALHFISGVFLFLGIILLLHPCSCITLTEKGFSYKRGKIDWEAPWDEVEALYLEKENLQIKTIHGSTELISLTIIRKKGNDLPNIRSFIALDYMKFAKKFGSYKNKDGKELIELLEKLSGKKAESYITKGWEKIRE